MKISSMQSLFCLLSAALFAFVSVAGEEMVVNGDFEEGYASDQSWGAYSDKDAYSNPGWSVTASGGLAKPDGTWMNNGLDVGGYALFLQSSTSSSATAYQEVSITEPGTYRISFRWAARPGHVGQSVRVIFDNTTLDTISTTDTSLQYWYKDVEINAAGSFSLYLVSEVASGDVATVFDSVSMRRIKKYTWTGGGQTSSVSDAQATGAAGPAARSNSTVPIISYLTRRRTLSSTLMSWSTAS